MKHFIEIPVPDAFEAQDRIRRKKGVKKVYTITATSLRVYYDNKQVEPRDILKTIKTKSK